MKSIGEKLKALRATKGWSQEEIAHQLDISLHGYGKIERNISNVTIKRLEQIAGLFKMSVLEFLAYGEKTTKNSYQKQLEAKDKQIMELQARIIQLLDKKK